jgi:hypothetical protein
MSEKPSDFIESCRTRARALKARHEELGSSISLSQAYELLAAADGYRTWAAMRAAGEKRAHPSAELPEIYEDEDGSVLSVWMTRRISLDAQDAQDRDDLAELLKAASADLTYVFMDGEDFPTMRFRDTQIVGDDEYSVVVDIEMSPAKDTAWHLGRFKHAENIVAHTFADYAGDHAVNDALIFGSSAANTANRWRSPEKTSSFC